MERLEGLAGTLRSLDDLQSIVRTMKALSAVSIRQYERAVQSLAQYTRTIDLGLRVVLRGMPEPAPPMRGSRGPDSFLVFGSDHGLCGRFNEDLSAFLLQRTRAHAAARIITVGVRLPPLIEDAGAHVDDALVAPASAAGIGATVNELLIRIDAWTREHDVARVFVVFQRRRAGAQPQPAARLLLPMDLARFQPPQAQPWPSHVLPTFRMDRDRLFADFARQYLFLTIYRACAESQTAEHASRLGAMEAAERNLDERRSELQALFRRQRQESITAELLDVVAGYETVARSSPRPGAPKDPLREG